MAVFAVFGGEAPSLLNFPAGLGYENLDEDVAAVETVPWCLVSPNHSQSNEDLLVSKCHFWAHHLIKSSPQTFS